MELQESVAQIGLKIKQAPDGCFAALGKKQWRLQSCEIAVLWLKSQVHANIQADAAVDTALVRLQRHVIQYLMLTAEQLESLRRPPEGATGPGLLWQYQQQLEEAGFDLEQLFDQAPPLVDPTQSKEVVALGVEAYTTETAKAWLLSVQGKGVWFPKSNCQYHDLKMIVVVPRWLAAAKGLKV
jgi:hypothetical protein